ncbi:MAG: PHB depolymerase family esterase, partial [Myxococcota bacterium]
VRAETRICVSVWPFMISLLALASPDPVTPPDINPGDLFSLEYVPTGLRDGSALLVVLHACEQSAADVDVETGWVREADRLGFALLFPEQKPVNNSFRCFNWFRPGDIERENGEARSIAEMVNEMLARHRLDANRVYITGLSAGAAMAQVMLATYPDVFAAGALIAGVPYGCGTDPASAFDCLNDPGVQDWGALLPETSAPWPRVSVWQGTGDTIVAPRNADALVSQWRAAHLQGPEAEIGSIPGGTRRQWGAPVTVVEQVILDDLAHGTPIAPDLGCGEIINGHTGTQMRVSARTVKRLTFLRVCLTLSPMQLQPPTPIPDDARFKVFLAGSIEMGTAPDWQSQVVTALAETEGILVLAARAGPLRPRQARRRVLPGRFLEKG